MSRVQFLVFDHETGEILRSGNCDESLLELQAHADNQTAIQFDADNGIDATHYVLNGEVVAKSEILLNISKVAVVANGVDEIVFAGVPLDAVVQLVHPDAHAEYVDHDGSVEFSTNLAGSHIIRAMGVPYISVEHRFEATA